MYIKTIYPIFIYIGIAIAFLLGLAQLIKNKPKVNPLLLFTTSQPLASLDEIAEAFERVDGLPRSKFFSLLIQGFWRGDFEGFKDKETRMVSRLVMLKVMHDVGSVFENFIFAYKPHRQPITSEDLPDGGCSVDLRPYLRVPDANTENWMEENCQEAFEELASQPENYREDSIWPDYIPEIMKAGFISIKISEKVLNSFLKKEKILK